MHTITFSLILWCTCGNERRDYQIEKSVKQIETCLIAGERKKKKMTKVVLPLLSQTASGQFAHSMVFDKRNYVRKYVVPANPKSVAQMTVRNRLGDIQRELKALGIILRPQVKLSLGARWNSLIISDLLNDEAAKWIADTATYTAFQAGEKTAWEGADPAVGNVNIAGLVFFLVAKSFYDVCLRIGGDGLIVMPDHDTAVATAAEWVAVA